MNHLPQPASGSSPVSRRTVLACGAQMLAAWGLRRPERATADEGATPGVVVGEPSVEPVGKRLLEDGGNAIDAMVATALAGCIAQPFQTGIGGYGAAGIFAVEGGRRVVALDANSTAPAALRADQFRPDAQGEVPNQINRYGWLAAGVPGVLAGLHLVQTRFGTKSFREVLQPAIHLARHGVPVTNALHGAIRGASREFLKDAGSRELYLPQAEPPTVGSLFRNPHLADLLETLAQANSVAPFYKGDIALRIAEAFQKQGGLLTTQDLSNYEARLVEPLAVAWEDAQLLTPPLTSGGLTVLQVLRVLQALGWDRQPEDLPRLQSRIEAVRLAWRDRLTLFGDPQAVAVPVEKLLSDDYARECAAQIRAAVQAGRILDHSLKPQTQGGTLSFSAADRDGNFAALTLTHGEGFGARVTVPGLGLTLGHGMSRFDPRPDHPNAPGPGKRPLHNMCPCLITRNKQPVVALGGRGGRKIPNSILEFVVSYLARGQGPRAALNAPRFHTEGDARVNFEPRWPGPMLEQLRRQPYDLQSGGAAATLSVVAQDREGLFAGMR